MADIQEAERSQLSSPASADAQLLNELKVRTAIMAEWVGWGDKLRDIRRDAGAFDDVSGGGSTTVVAPSAPSVSGFSAAGASPRQVATACRLPNAVSPSSYNRLNSRSRHIARADITQLAIRYGNWTARNATSGVESGNTGAQTLTFTAAIEYPIGSAIAGQIKWSGATSVAVPNLTNSPLSDICVLNTTIPAGEAFMVRTFQTAPTNNAVVYEIQQNAVGSFPATPAADTANGEQMRGGFDAGVDETMLFGSFTAAAGTSFPTGRAGPLAIVAPGTHKAVWMIGTSITWGVHDVIQGASGDRGLTARAIGPSYAYSNFGHLGASLSQQVANYTNRRQFAQYFTHGILEVRNDWSQAFTPAQCVANLQAMQSLIGIPCFPVTITPTATSTDDWATTVNQTANADSADIYATNDLIRAGIAGLQPEFIDIADVAMSARDSGLWAVDGTAFKYTSDGTHSTFGLNDLIRSGGAAASVISAIAA